MPDWLIYSKSAPKVQTRLANVPRKHAEQVRQTLLDDNLFPQDTVVERVKKTKRAWRRRNP